MRSLLEEHPAALTAVGLAEVLDHLTRVVGADPEEAALDLATLGFLDPLLLDARTATDAGLLRGRRYHRSRCPVSLADCIAAEITRRIGAELASSDPDLLDVCHVEGIAIRPLPASDGGTWSPRR